MVPRFREWIAFFGVPHRRRRLIALMLVATLVTAGAAWMLVGTITPFSLELVERGNPRLHPMFNRLYRDLDSDGRSETLHMWTPPMGGDGYIQVFNQSGEIISQLNFRDPIRSDWLYFEDWTGDGVEEVFSFSQRSDTLFLTVHDVDGRREVLSRTPVLSAPPYNPHHLWDVHVLPVGLVDVDGDGVSELVTVIKAAFALYPRAVVAIDPASGAIKRRFDTGAQFIRAFRHDLTGDGRPEVILTSAATGNIEEAIPFRDDRSWLFVLKPDLSPLFAPIPFGEYPSGLGCSPVTIGDRPHLMVHAKYHGEKDVRDGFYLVDGRGRTVAKKIGYFVEYRHMRAELFVDHEGVAPALLATTRSGNLLRIDTSFAPAVQRETHWAGIYPVAFEDITGDGQADLLTRSPEGLALWSRHLDFLGRIDADIRTHGRVILGVRRMGKGVPAEISYTDGDRFQRFALRRNWFVPDTPWWLAILWVTTVVAGSLALFAMDRRAIHRQLLHESGSDDARPMFILDAGGHLRHWNRAASPYIGNGGAPVVGDHFARVFDDRPDIVSVIGGALATGEPVDAELAEADDGDGVGSLRVRIRPGRSWGGLKRSALVVLDSNRDGDLSGRLQVWSRSVQMMVHQIKNPLNALSLNLYAVDARLRELGNGVPGDVIADLEVIRQELDAVTELTRKFVRYSDLTRPAFAIVHVADMLETLKERYARLHPGVEIQLRIDREAPLARVDPAKIETVLGILIDNAVEAMGGRGTIRLELQAAREVAGPDEGHLSVTVADRGPGMATRILDSLFERFVTTKSRGVGIGLVIAKKIIEDHGGTIAIDSRQGLGTTVSFTLPAIREEKP